MDDQRADGRRPDAEAWHGAAPERPRDLSSRHYGSVLRFFQRQGFPEEEALELTQETFLRVSQSIGTLRSAAAEEVWLRRIVANIWKNEIRRRRTLKRDVHVVSLEAERESGNEAVESALPPGSRRDPDPEEQVLGTEHLAAVRRCLAALPPRMRRCLVLYSLRERKYREIAELLHLSIDTVKSHIHQARQLLRQCVAGQETRRGA